MKNLIIPTLVCGLLSASMVAQEKQDVTQQNLFVAVEKSFELKLAQYEESQSIFTDASFAAQFPKVFQTSLLNPDATVFGGKAASYAIDKRSHAMSINYNVPSKDSQWLFNVGFNLKGTTNGYALYKRDTWYNVLNLSFGADHVLKTWGSKGSGDTEKTVQTQKSRKAIVHQELEKLKNQTYLAQQKLTDSTSIDTYTNAVLNSFDSKLPAGKMYGAMWLNLTANAGLTTFGIAGTANIDETIQDKYKAMFRPSVTASLNYFKRTAKVTKYAKIYGGFTWGNIFDSPIYSDMNMKVVSSTFGYQVLDANNRRITAYEDIKDKITYIDAGISYANFFACKQALGLSLNAAANFPVNNNSAGSYSPNYSVLAGPIIKMTGKNDWTAATLSITGGIEKRLYSQVAFNDAVLKIGLAVPLELFTK
ncbi:hypothetical protein SAMN05216480_10651 [Pustulibacterium marinum]|uniref:DUF5723 domain-containing protein n=1 Tax=Pustulibacterium marinum TaxID=1224947 RepID=A0A1I7GWM9_9FLAO|nr:hypothetical protein [Pustulibacterium marinum]SFU52841.1 hypothetical protein SAMN05216480_10651 [Pustulibacterium marinum]